MLHISNQSVTLLPVTSGQSLTLPEGQFCTGQSGSRCNQRARQCIGAAKGRTASIWSPQCMKGSSPALKKGEQILPWSIFVASELWHSDGKNDVHSQRWNNLDVTVRLSLSHRNSDIMTARSPQQHASHVTSAISGQSFTLLINLWHCWQNMFQIHLKPKERLIKLKGLCY